MTQYEHDLLYWRQIRDTARNFTEWYFAQERVSAIFRAMGYGDGGNEAIDRELIFPRVREYFEERQ